MPNATLSVENTHLIINGIVLLFLVVNLCVNWKLIRALRTKILNAYRESLKNR